MAVDVHEASSYDYSTKPTSQVSTPPSRDHQNNNNQTIPTITTKDQNIDIPADISPGVFISDDDFHKMTLVEQKFSDTSNDGDDQFTPSMFDIDPTIETTTATTTGTSTTAEMTLEKFQQWEDEHYEAEDRTEEAARPTSKWISAAMAFHSDIFAPIEETTTATITENDNATAANATETTTHMPTMIKDIATNDTPIHTDTPNTIIEEAEEEQQQTRHTQSKDRPVSVISNTNKNKKKKNQKKATLKMTHMLTVIKEEPNHDEVQATTTNIPPKTTHVPMIIEQDDEEERVPL